MVDGFPLPGTCPPVLYLPRTGKRNGARKTEKGFKWSDFLIAILVYILLSGCYLDIDLTFKDIDLTFQWFGWSNLSKSSLPEPLLTGVGFYQWHYHLLLDGCIPVCIRFSICKEIGDLFQVYIGSEKGQAGEKAQLWSPFLLKNQPRYWRIQTF